MSPVAVAAGWVVAAVLGWAGAAKLRNPTRTAEGFARLGVTAPRAAAHLVPLVELAVAVVLVVRPRAGGVAALVLLAALTAFAISRLARGIDAPCGCFGAAREEPLTLAVPVRNTLLMLAAGAAVAGPATGPAWTTLEAVVLTGTAVALGAVVVALVELRATTGRLWDNRLPTGPDGLT